MLKKVAYLWMEKCGNLVSLIKDFCTRIRFQRRTFGVFNFRQYLKNLVRVPRIVIKFDIVFYLLFGVIMVGCTRDLLQNFRLECRTRSTLAAVF